MGKKDCRSVCLGDNDYFLLFQLYYICITQLRGMCCEYTSMYIAIYILKSKKIYGWVDIVWLRSWITV